VQAAWLYLEPIFSSDDISKQLPTESSMFKVVNGVWIESMAATAREPAVLAVAARPGLLASLTDACEKLEIIERGLSDYLETKRLAFPRFYFLSNDELLEILAETKDPTKVQPHMKKCFDGVAHLDFDADLNILGAFDAPPPKGEALPFTYKECNHKMINPKYSGGNVEKWLVEVETMMKKSLAYSVDASVKDFFEIERKQWLRNWPGQTILTVNQITWVMAMEKAIESGGGAAIAAVHATRVEELLEVVDTVRGDIPKQLRGTLGGLVVMDVHNRDITEWLSKTSINTITEFDWQAQLRYYWDDQGVSSQTGKPETIPCRMINAMILYAYEYIGNCGRLVITPLTDRCYRTLMGAIHLNLGGAPEGPAGTGKTETTKDLGKAIAIQCVVTNCSDGLDYKAMAKFFKGLAASGAWACFDEFNRIILEVLSVVAQQVLTIQQAKARKAERFMFEGTDLPLRMTCCPFITMNPGYAGRAELPDNLKVLFRTVAMMVPDYGMIGEIILYSMGYTDAKAMAIKIVTTYKLCSEQLSAQSHYDYGMRAVIAVLRASGNLKRSEGHLPEDILVLRAIIDVNAPKFLAPDVPLFNGITSDLFPGVDLPEPDRKAMKDKSTESCVERNFQLTEYFWGKIVQIYDMMVVRHGFMIVGSPFSGKTSAYRVLADALSKLHAEYPDDGKWTDVVPFVMNPKSVTMGQLYGCFDPVSHEWTDGVLAIQYRNAAQSKVGKPEDRKWVLLDGPVDAIWIENMNTVLDDNKKLCLMSGEIIAMSDVMSMIFEPMDLLVASPATVSRCGMVYMEPEQLGLRPLWDSWVRGWTVGGYYHQEVTDEGPPFELSEEEQVHLTALYDWLVEPSMACLRRNCKEMSPTGDANLLTSLLGLLRCLLTAAIPGKHDADPEDGGSRQKQLECCFLFALFWSTGATSDAVGRAKYSLFVREVMENVGVIDEKYGGVATALAVRKWTKPDYTEDATGFIGQVECPPPDTGDLQDWCYLPREGTWTNWVDTLDKFAIDEEAEFSTIMVPTACTAQLSYMCRTLLTHGLRPLVCGPTGTGKSVSVVKCVTSELDQAKFKPIQLGFSAKTSAHMTQDIIDGNLSKRRKGMFGPPMGQTAVIFVDDMNMPEVETYGAQPPIELLRQLVDFGGYYDLKEKSWVTIVDTVMCCAMGPPGGGRNGTTPRFLRHFSLLCVDSFDDDTLTLIFSTIVKAYFTRGYSGDVCQQAGNVVTATMRTYREAMKGLLPTPSKSHYTFNLRDFSRVVQGVLLQEPSEDFSTKPGVMRLWTHEALRVFGDRLTDDTDRQWMCAHAATMCKEVFKCDFQSEFERITPSDETETGYGTLRRLFWGDYMTAADEDERPYAEVPDLDLLRERTEAALEEFNAASKKPMGLVMFMFAIEHVSRIARVLRMPGGNALLVGVGGSGRQSLSILATEMAGYQLFRIEITKSYGMLEWRDDLKNVLIEAGAGDRPLVFLFSDTQISREAFVEDINNMLNAGEVPNIFPSDEKVAICEKIRPFAKEQFGRAAGDMTPLQLYAYFIQRVKQYLHIILAFSPIGSAFRDRLRLFPSLVNCCAIDWFTAWPGDALLAVAEKFLKEVKLDDAVRPAIVEMCMSFHTNAHDLAATFLAEQGRITYVTPTSYLELIVAFKLALQEQRDNITSGKERYVNGLKQLAGAEDNVATMQVELTDLQPVLAEAQIATDALMEEIEAKLPGVREQEEIVGAEAAVAQKEADIVQIEVDSVQADLDEALPALESAVQALNTIKDEDINAVRKLGKPPATVKLVAEGVCVMLSIKGVKIADPDDSSKKIMDYWGPSQKMMADKNFVQGLKDYDKDNINPKIMKTIRTTYMPNEKFNAESAAKASSAAAGLCKWVLAMECYDRVAKVVGPKKEALAVTQASLAVTMGELNEKKASLKVVQDDLGALQANLAGAEKKKKDLLDQVDLCGKKLVNAKKLIDGLGGEKTKWGVFVEELDAAYVNLTGDVLVSAGLMAYLGPFTSTFRQRQMADWVTMSKKLSVPSSEKPTLINTLGDAVKVRQWNIEGLPTDDFSVENAITIFAARRWPLIIDPQGQANKWIRQMEAPNKLNVLKMTGEYMRNMESAIQFGFPVLLEDVGEVLDATLEPLLLKQIFKQGGVDCIRLGDATIEYSELFRFYICTKLRNPHYVPETSVKVTLLNFMITPQGLQDQLLGVVVARERADLEEKKNELVLEGAENKRKLKEIEDEILEILSGEGNILENETAIVTLNQSKITSDDIKAKQAVAEKTEIEIDTVRKGYTSVAYSTQVLFFCISTLENIEPVYSYSLDWFINLFVASIKNSEPASDVPTRLDILFNHFIYSLYKNICRSLLEKDKLLFSFVLTIRILQGKDELDDAEWLFFLTGGVSLDNPHDNPAQDWLAPKLWNEICLLDDIPAFKGLRAHVDNVPHQWRKLYDSIEPQDESLPGKWDKLTGLKRLCVLRCMRPDKVVLGVQKFVIGEMGEEFVRPPPFDLQACYDESSCVQPLVFVLAPGSDPMGSVLEAAEAIGREVGPISLGQGQGPVAETLIAKSRKEGSWVVLQNCHLAESFMTRFEAICESLSEPRPHENFRLWCTTCPSPVFPTAVLQNGIKMAIEPPKGLRANLVGSYSAAPLVNKGYLESNTKPEKFRKLCYSLCMFHALLQERRLYGPLGWNIAYGFNESDMLISLQQLFAFLEENEETPFKALKYCIGECNYGGRVTDGKDRITLNSIMERFFNEDVLETGYKMSPSGTFTTPGVESRDEFLAEIEGLPLVAPPEIFGFHENANITKDTKETNAMFATCLLCEGGGGGGGSGDKDATIAATAGDIKEKLPAAYDMEQAAISYPVLWEQSMNTVLCQELARFNNLTNCIQKSLVDVEKAVKGIVVMSGPLEALGDSLVYGAIPLMWKAKSYPSFKPLAGYVTDLLERLTFLNEWLCDKPPSTYWISAFFFQHAFMTASKQNYSRAETIPIDAIGLQFEMLQASSYAKPPALGVYVYGFFFEGARWDKKQKKILESEPKVLFTTAPLMWFQPKQTVQIRHPPSYLCPVYKTGDRRGILATTGHSTNFILDIFVPSDVPEAHWVQRGVAMLSQLDD
jgi:dynein heavy chain